MMGSECVHRSLGVWKQLLPVHNLLGLRVAVSGGSRGAVRGPIGVVGGEQEETVRS